MVFSSLKFIFTFMPLFFLCYYVSDARIKNIVILIFSLGFYAYGCFDNPQYLLLLFLSLVINYYFAIFIDKSNNKKKLCLIVAIFCNLLILFVFKYYNLFVDVINGIINNVPIKKLNIILPLGISFYTFQTISYLVDVYNSKIEVELKFTSFATYVIMFPQLIAGPIVRYEDIMKTMNNDRRFNKEDLLSGISLFIIGLSSKVIIANQLSTIQLDISNYIYSDLCILSSWGAAIAYTMQLYFDFFGYSLMAMGLGRMMGFIIPENFRDPLLSTSISEFWRRWHITLGSFFRDYIYIPLGGKYKYSLRNKAVVWLLTGLWHGANYNFALWGLYFFVFVLLEQKLLYRILDRSKIISHIYTFLVVVLSFVIFRNEDLGQMSIYFKKMFGVNAAIINDTFYYAIVKNYKQIIIATLCVLRVPNILYSKINKIKVLNVITLSALFAICIYLIYLGYADPFMYFRF